MRAYAYLGILAIHFLYAAWALRARRFSLEIGPIRHPAAILAGLLVMNGFSASVFFLPSPAWKWLNVGFHALLAGDEALRLRKAPARWPFLLDHVLFALVLAG